MPRFVVLEHDHPVLHWDLMLETGDVLRTWRLTEAPRPGLPAEAAAIHDHRLFYLEYEGPVSGGRGSVVRWDVGDYELGKIDDDHIVFHLLGARLQGTVSLRRQTSTEWAFQFLTSVDDGGLS